MPNFKEKGVCQRVKTFLLCCGIQPEILRRSQDNGLVALFYETLAKLNTTRTQDVEVMARTFDEHCVGLPYFDALLPASQADPPELWTLITEIIALCPWLSSMLLIDSKFATFVEILALTKGSPQGLMQKAFHNLIFRPWKYQSVQTVQPAELADSLGLNVSDLFTPTIRESPVALAEIWYERIFHAQSDRIELFFAALIAIRRREGGLLRTDIWGIVARNPFKVTPFAISLKELNGLAPLMAGLFTLFLSGGWSCVVDMWPMGDFAARLQVEWDRRCTGAKDNERDTRLMTWLEEIILHSIYLPDLPLSKALAVVPTTCVVAAEKAKGKVRMTFSFALDKELSPLERSVLDKKLIQFLASQNIPASIAPSLHELFAEKPSARLNEDSSSSPKRRKEAESESAYVQSQEFLQ
jgi:hypothetical protein